MSAATNLITRTPLGGGARTLYKAPSGALLPEESANELEQEDVPYVEVPLSGALRGGALRVAYIARPLARAPLLAVTLAMLLFTLFIGSAVGRAVSRDLRGVTTQIDRVAREEEPGPLRSVATAEVRRLTHAVNRLLERIPRFTVESFLAIERAEEAQRLKSQFLANMSHDLRSPLNSILGFSELLLRGIEGEITAQQRRALNTVQDRGNQLLRLLNEILDTAKVESGKMELHRQTSPPAELVRAALQEAQRGRPVKPDQVSVVLQPGLPAIHIDPLRITQAVTHLLNYAIDAALEGSRDGHVTLRARGRGASGRLFVVEIEHAGELDDDEAGHLFDGFRRVRVQNGLVIRGKPEAIRAAVVALLARGHLLIEDIPGVGKTTLARALARVARRHVPPHPVHERSPAVGHRRRLDLRPERQGVRAQARARSSPTSCSPTRSTAPRRARSRRCSRR